MPIKEYFATGLLKKMYGSRLYPVEYTYDAQGRMKTMKTWKNFSQGSGTAITTWNYNAYRGWLDSKTYDNGSAAGPVYSYTPGGRLQTRLWARGTNTTYSYNQAGDLATIIYNDGVTPGVTNGYDRRGRQWAVTNSTTICTRMFDDAGSLLSEAYLSGVLSGLTVSNVYDVVLRRTTNGLWNGSAWLTQARYTYDAASRLKTVGDGTAVATYDYVANSPLVSQISFTSSGVQRMLTTKQYDLLNRLANISSSGGGSTVVSFAYQNNDANQRTRRTESDGAYWVYSYDSLRAIRVKPLLRLLGLTPALPCCQSGAMPRQARIEYPGAMYNVPLLHLGTPVSASVCLSGSCGGSCRQRPTHPTRPWNVKVKSRGLTQA